MPSRSLAAFFVTAKSRSLYWRSSAAGISGAWSRTATPPRRRRGTPSVAAIPSSRSPSATMSSRISVTRSLPVARALRTSRQRLDATGIQLIYLRPHQVTGATIQVSGATRMFVSGEWRDALSGAESRASSPATGADLGPVADGDREDARRAIAAAADAFPGWSAETAFARRDALHRIADVCERRREDLAQALTLDQGKPLHAESYDEVDELIAMWRGAAEDGVRLEGSLPPSSSPGKRVLLVR